MPGLGLPWWLLAEQVGEGTEIDVDLGADLIEAGLGLDTGGGTLVFGITFHRLGRIPGVAVAVHPVLSLALEGAFSFHAGQPRRIHRISAIHVCFVQKIPAVGSHALVQWPRGVGQPRVQDAGNAKLVHGLGTDIPVHVLAQLAGVGDGGDGGDRSHALIFPEHVQLVAVLEELGVAAVAGEVDDQAGLFAAAGGLLRLSGKLDGSGPGIHGRESAVEVSVEVLVEAAHARALQDRLQGAKDVGCRVPRGSIWGMLGVGLNCLVLLDQPAAGGEHLIVGRAVEVLCGDLRRARGLGSLGAGAEVDRAVEDTVATAAVLRHGIQELDGQRDVLADDRDVVQDGAADGGPSVASEHVWGRIVPSRRYVATVAIVSTLRRTGLRLGRLSEACHAVEGDGRVCERGEALEGHRHEG